jgi:hypothetical protein
MMDDFKPGADGTHNVCAVGHCGVYRRLKVTLFLKMKIPPH